MAEFGRSKHAWFRTFFDLPNGIPSHDTSWRVFRALDPDHFQTCFLNWIRATSPLIKGQVIAIDGKQSRLSHDKGLGRSTIYMVSAWATANHLVLGQRKVTEKSNEITADAGGFKTASDASGLQHQVCKKHVLNNSEAWHEAMAPELARDADGSLAAIGVTPDQALADNDELLRLMQAANPRPKPTPNWKRFMRVTLKPVRRASWGRTPKPWPTGCACLAWIVGTSGPA